jgi:hypothetical protein
MCRGCVNLTPIDQLGLKSPSRVDEDPVSVLLGAAG